VPDPVLDPPAAAPSRWRDLARRVAVPAVLLFSLTAGGVAMCGLPGDSLDDGEGIVGTYVVNGVDPAEIEYSGTVRIAEGDAAGEYVVQWTVTGAIQEGVGVLDGDTFTVEWRTITGGRGDTSTGTAVYTVGDDGVLRGTRVIDGSDAAGTEEIFPEP
jgi:hypothetical protein